MNAVVLPTRAEKHRRGRKRAEKEKGDPQTRITFSNLGLSLCDKPK
jgi:hypothetical protein